MKDCTRRLIRNLVSGIGLEVMAIAAHEWTKDRVPKTESNVIAGMFAVTGGHFIGAGLNKWRKCRR